MRDSGCDISDVKRAAYRDGSAYGARKARADQATVSQWRPEPSSLSATCVPPVSPQHAVTGSQVAKTLNLMVPRDGLQESRIIKGLPPSGTLELFSVLFSFPHHGVPPKGLTNKLYERLPL
jgi:hypothetical protein